MADRKKLHDTRRRGGKKNVEAEVSENQGCAICKEDIIDNPTTFQEQGIECECCLRWFHLICVKLTEEKSEAIEKFNLHWYCDNCEHGAMTLHQHCTALRAENTLIKKDILKLTERIKKCEQVDSTMDQRMKKNEASVTSKVEQARERMKAGLKTEINENLNKEINEKVTAEANILKQMVEEKIAEERAKIKEELKTEMQLPPGNNGTYADVAATGELVREMEAPTRFMIREELEENLRIQQRKNNLVVLNLDENVGEGRSENDDLANINEIVKEKLNLNIEITNAKRLGTYDATKTRPVRVVFERLDDKKRILSRAINLRELHDSDKYCKVYIRPDLTQAQLKESKNLHDQLVKKREENSDQYWKIYRGRIVEAELVRGRLVAVDPNPLET